MNSGQVDKTADVSPEAFVGRGTMVWNWTKVREGARIGEDVVIGQHCYIDHDVVIGDRCGVMHNVSIGTNMGAGAPVIGDDVFIGTGATLLGPITVGANAKIGAGAFIHMRDVPPNSTVVGGPARIVKRNGERVEEELARTAEPEAEATDR